MAHNLFICLFLLSNYDFCIENNDFYKKNYPDFLYRIQKILYCYN